MTVYSRGRNPASRNGSLIRTISASSFVDLAFSCTCSEVGWDLCAGSVRGPITAWVRDVDAAPVRPRDGCPFQGLHRFSLTINDSNKPGNLLSLKSQVSPIQQMGFGHSYETHKRMGDTINNIKRRRKSIETIVSGLPVYATFLDDASADEIVGYLSSLDARSQRITEIKPA
jgi:hypothetical protein